MSDLNLSTGAVVAASRSNQQPWTTSKMTVAQVHRTDFLVSKLEGLAELSLEERTALLSLSSTFVSARSGERICPSNEVPSGTFLVLEGWISASKHTGGSKRQITTFYIPGDMPGLRSLHLELADDHLVAVTACRLLLLDHGALLALTRAHPRIAEALWTCTLVAGSIFEEWIVNVGSRPAISRLAHLFCELMTRLEAAGLAHDGRCSLPLTQTHLGEATGLSRIQINRSLQELRKQGLVSFAYDQLIIHDRAGLARVAQFNPSYLHLQHATRDRLSEPG